MKLGIIAEDYSDVAVLKKITLTLLHYDKVGFKHFVGNGCGKLRRKCGAWAENLSRQGCSWVVVAHDLDRYNEIPLRLELERAIAGARLNARIVVIPNKEIEAWLLFDSEALRKAFNGKNNPRLPGNPESLDDPKKKLAELAWKSFRKNYVNTIHNEKIAQHIDPKKLKHAKSFSLYPPFVNTIKKQLKFS